jgi:threonyl-tRNA synthetase
MVNDLVGKGLPMYLPNGYIVWSELEEYIKEKERDLDYQHVLTPPMGSVELYKTSGHWDHYKDSMFPAMEVENETFVLRPMNCPHHMMIYKEGLHSYRDLPIRIGEIARDMRFEASGTLKGIERVRCFCQNDAHLFVTPEQIKEEFEKVVKLILDVYKDFNITNYEFRLSLRDPEDKEKYYPDDEMWNTAEDTLRKVLNEIGITYQEEIGEAAFYGPKLDVQVKPAVGNEYTISTCQLDFCLPQRFELAYTDSQGNKQTPVVLHRAILGSIDRFIAYILEETKGIFPFWLTPEQVRIITVADAFLPYAEQVKKQLRSEKFRVSIDEGNDSFSKKIRNAEVQKVPYILIVGEKEEKAGSVSVREFKTKEQYELDVKEFVEKISVIRDEKRL